jgi:NAD(P)-dependent dehydrogenase (short-subunit alcohol dehydrogenase family)
MMTAGKRVMVTGAASGIGLGVSRHFAERGASVMMADLHGDAAEQAASRIGGATRAAACDVRAAADVKAAVDAAVQAFGGLDVLVSCAGVAYSAPILDHDEDEFTRVMDVNLTGTFLGVKYGGAAIVAGGGGAIVNISSVAGMGRSRAFSSAYCASKAAVVALTQVAAIEMRDLNVRVNAVSPGMTDTPMLGDAARQRAQQGRRAAGMSIAESQGRMATPTDIAGAVAFLCSDEASLITGCVLPVDGGRTARLDFHLQDVLSQWVDDQRVHADDRA